MEACPTAVGVILNDREVHIGERALKAAIAAGLTNDVSRTFDVLCSLKESYTVAGGYDAGVFVPLAEALVMQFILQKDVETCQSASPVLSAIGLHSAIKAVKHSDECDVARQITRNLRQSVDLTNHYLQLFNTSAK